MRQQESGDDAAGPDAGIDVVHAPRGDGVNIAGSEGADSIADRPIVDDLFDSGVEEVCM